MEETTEKVKKTRKHKRTTFKESITVKIRADVYWKLSAFADEKGRLIQAVTTDAVEEYLRRNF
jgi:hypothetical protein